MPARKLLLFACLSLADLGLTWHLLAHGEGQVYEGNPLAHWWLAHYGWPGLTCFKVALALLVVGLTLAIAGQRPQAAGRVLLLSCAILAAVVLYSSLLAVAVAAPSVAPGLLDAEMAAQSTRTRDLDRQLQQVEVYHQFRERLSDDLIARRRTLPEAASLLADFARQRKPDWLGGLGRFYPGRCEQACVAACLVDDTLFRLQDGDPAAEETARRLVSDYRACYGVPFTLPR
jgi:hypothetical protein